MKPPPLWPECSAWQHAHGRGLRAGIAADIQRFLNKSPENQAVGNTWKSRLGALLTPQLMALVLWRTAHLLHLRGWPRTAALLTQLNALVHRTHLGADSCIGPGAMLPHPAGVLFSGRAGPGLTLYSLCCCSPRSAHPEAPAADGPRLGAGVGVGAHAAVLGAVTVGDGTRIGFAVRLDHGVPPGARVLQRHLRPRFTPRAASPGTGAR